MVKLTSYKNNSNLTMNDPLRNKRHSNFLGVMEVCPKVDKNNIYVHFRFIKTFTNFSCEMIYKIFFLLKSNLDVSIGDTERWVSTSLLYLCQQPTQRSVSPILTSKFDKL